MNHDFTTKVDRRGTGSAKWEDMFSKKPNVSSEIVPLSVADMELVNPPEIIEGLREHLLHTVLGYTMPTESYNKAVVDWMRRRHNWTIQGEWITQSPGVVPAFFIAVRAFTEPGDGVIIQPPVYYPFSMAVNLNGRTLVNNPLVLENGTYRMDYDDLEKKASDPKNKILILCSPHNPVGRVWKWEELEHLAEICNRHKVLVISDEIHFDLLLPGVEHTVYSTISEEAAQNCIVCTAPSKTFNLAGMAASNNITPNKELREKLTAEFMKSAIFMIGNLGLKACELAYTKAEGWLDELLQLLKTNHELVKDYCARHIPKITVFPLEGTYLQWLDFRAFGMDYHELEQFMIGEADWFLDEGAMFGEEGRGFERVNIACPTKVLEEALDRLRSALQARKLI
jgi:putative C-S lyase